MWRLKQVFEADTWWFPTLTRCIWCLNLTRAWIQQRHNIKEKKEPKEMLGCNMKSSTYPWAQYSTLPTFVGAMGKAKVLHSLFAWSVLVSHDSMTGSSGPTAIYHFTGCLRTSSRWNSQFLGAGPSDLIMTGSAHLQVNRRTHRHGPPHSPGKLRLHPHLTHTRTHTHL